MASPFPLSNDLLEDLFNPSISTLDLCNLHAISLPKLADLLESAEFQLAQRSFERINTARKHIIETESHTHNPEAEPITPKPPSAAPSDQKSLPTKQKTLVSPQKQMIYSSKTFQHTPAERVNMHSHKKNKQILALISMLMGTAVSLSHAQNAFTYQGQLNEAGAPANGNYVMRFSLWDDATPGAPDMQLGTTIIIPSITIADGLFNVDLDFGDEYLSTTAARYLQIEVRRVSDGAFTTLDPRTQLTHAPRSVFANDAATSQLTQGLDLPIAASGSDADLDPFDSLFHISHLGINGNAIRADSNDTAVLAIASGFSSIIPSSNGTAIAGLADNYGVFGSAQHGYGIYGVSLEGTGGYFQTESDSSSRQALWARSSGGSNAGAGLFEIDNTNSSADALVARTASTYGSVYAVRGVLEADNPGSYAAGVLGQVIGSGNQGIGVYGSNAGGGWGVYGSSNTGIAVNAVSNSGIAGRFRNTSSSTIADALYVSSDSTQFSANAIHGVITSTSPGSKSAAVRGENKGTGSLGVGVFGTQAGSGYGVWGESGINGYGIVGSTAGANGYAGYFFGNVNVTGTLSKGSGTFKIDHPLDPANMYLSHSFVESPEMKNIYDGVVTLDDSGSATVTMPSYFDALNTEFRYQLTCIGGYAPVYIAREINERQFSIAGGSPGLKVSWQITGVRQDPFALEHPVIVEEEKSSEDRGRYLHPELYAQPKEKTIGYISQPKPSTN